MPRRRQGPRLCLTISDDAGDDQIGIVERHAIRVRQAIAEFTSFVDRARSFGRDVAADVPGEGELLEELPHSFRVFALIRVDFGVGSLEICRAQHSGRAMAWSGDEDYVEVVLTN